MINSERQLQVIDRVAPLTVCISHRTLIIQVLNRVQLNLLFATRGMAAKPDMFLCCTLNVSTNGICVI